MTTRRQRLPQRARKAVVGFVTAFSTWCATWLPTMWAGLEAALAVPVVVYMVPNDEQRHRAASGRLQGDAGAIDPGSLALGMIAGLALGYLVWHGGPR